MEMRQSWLWRVKTVLLLSSTKNNNRKKIRMTHQNENSQNNTAVQHILDNGLDGIGEAIRLVIDQAMKIERSHVLQAQPHERTEKRQGYANGFKGKTVSTRMGDIRFSVPRFAATWTSIPALWKRVSEANAPSSWPSPKCMSRASPPAKSPPCSNNFAAWKYPPPKSVRPPPKWTWNWPNGATAPWASSNTSSWMPVTKKSASTARFDSVPFSSPWAWTPKASASCWASAPN